jgi:diguanylate cyclase (GGDEF)-like protein
MLGSPSGGGDLQESGELRSQVVRALQGRGRMIVNDTLAVYPFAGMEKVEPRDLSSLAELIFRLLSAVVRDGAIDSRSAAVRDLREWAVEKDINVGLLFNAVYLMERSTLDELALNASFGATSSRPWPAIAQIVRRSSFTVCAAISEHMSREPGDGAMIDPLTRLYTRNVFLAVLDKELQRSDRFRHPFALILLDVDRLAEINDKHGYGVGDRVLERIGIGVAKYFRETDWVARTSGDTFAVLLPETQSAKAEHLADSVRTMVEERLQLTNHRSEQPFSVTVSVGLLIAESIDRSVSASDLLMQVRAAVDRAKQGGRNRLERVYVNTGAPSVPPRGATSTT